MSVKRIYVEKRTPYAVRAKELLEEIRDYLEISTVESVRVLIRYDMENLSDPQRALPYMGAVFVRRYGRKIPKHVLQSSA